MHRYLASYMRCGVRPISRDRCSLSRTPRPRAAEPTLEGLSRRQLKLKVRAVPQRYQVPEIAVPGPIPEIPRPLAHLPEPSEGMAASAVRRKRRIPEPSKICTRAELFRAAASLSKVCASCKKQPQNVPPNVSQTPRRFLSSPRSISDLSLYARRAKLSLLLAKCVGDPSAK